MMSASSFPFFNRTALPQNGGWGANSSHCSATPKKLKGELSGFSRIRVGKIRIIFQIRRETNEIFIYDVN